MGRFHDLASAGAAGNGDRLPEVWAQYFPCLREAMYPEPGKASGTFLTPRYSVTLFAEGSRLKAVVGAREGDRKFWLTLDGPEAVLEQIEMALVKGHGEWRDSKEQK